MIQAQIVFRSLPYLPDRVTEASSQGIAALPVSRANRLPPYFRLAAGSGFHLGVQLARFPVLLASVGRTAVGSPDHRVKFPPRSAFTPPAFVSGRPGHRGRQIGIGCARSLRWLCDAGAYAVDRSCRHRPIIGAPEFIAPGHPILSVATNAVKGGAP